MFRKVGAFILPAIVAVAGLIGSTSAAMAAPTGTVPGLFGTTIDMWQSGCRTEQRVSGSSKTLVVEEPVVRNASSASFAKVRLTVYVWFRATSTSPWSYWPAVSYGKVAAKSLTSGVQQPQMVVMFGTHSQPIDFNTHGFVTIMERLEYLDGANVRQGNVVDQWPATYTYIYSYNLGLDSTVVGACQF